MMMGVLLLIVLIVIALVVVTIEESERDEAQDMRDVSEYISDILDEEVVVLHLNYGDEVDYSSLEEGDKCPVEDCDGRIEIPPVVDCSCHIIAPCGSCEDNPLACNTCGEIFE